MIVSVILAVVAITVYLGFRVWSSLLCIGFKLAAERARRDNLAFAAHHGLMPPPGGAPITFTRWERILMAIFVPTGDL